MTAVSQHKPSWRNQVLVVAFLLTLVPVTSWCAEEPGAAADEPAPAAPDPSSPLDTHTLDTLAAFVDLRKDLLLQIKEVSGQIGKAQTEDEKQELRLRHSALEKDLGAVRRNFENLAAGTDMNALRDGRQEEFNFQKELFGLLKPALDEMKDMTSHVRKKATLRDQIDDYRQRLPVLERALGNIDRLLEHSENAAVTQGLELTAEEWRKQQTLMSSELQALELQLDGLVESEVSLSQASRSYFKSFFDKRGRYLLVAMLVVAAILVLSRISLGAMRRYIPGFRKAHRSFHFRLAELLHRILTVVLVICGPMVVFYVVEDWVLFSLSVLLLIGVGWTLRQAIPKYIKQIQLFLNIGSVREDERVYMDGLPWRVEEINFFCKLSNPTARLVQRVPIEDLVDLKSRPAPASEPWFPCQMGDWVILGDGVRGKVVAISPELVQLVQRGGAMLTYQTSDFLSASPRNLGTNFRIKETIGISYKHQKESTTLIPDTLYAYLKQRIEDEGYGPQLMNLRVEFERANNSSLDLVAIADFKGELGDLYNRLRRSLQRWCVDACSEYGWEIPFPQLTVHGAARRGE